MTNVKPVTGKSAAALPVARPNLSDLHKSLAYSLRRAQLSTYGNFLGYFDFFDIRPAQYTTLVIIRANPGLTQSAVSNAIGVQKANFVTLLDRLEARGLTERRKVGGDRRSSALYLTPAGKTFVARMEAAHQQMEEDLLGRLGNARSELLLTLLHEFSTTPLEGAMPATVQAVAAPKVRKVKPVETSPPSAAKSAKRRQSARPAPLPRARKPSPD